MNLTDHGNYAEKVLGNLADDHSESEMFEFEPDRTQTRNAAKAMTAIFIGRLLTNSERQPRLKRNSTYEWAEGILNCRNIADRNYLWTNVRRGLADALHAAATHQPTIYLMAFSSSSDTTIKVWAIPEPIVYDSLSSLPLKKD